MISSIGYRILNIEYNFYYLFINNKKLSSNREYKYD